VSSVKIRDHRDILLAPVVSEKSYALLDENKYTFLVHPDSNKTEIKIAVEKIFNVKVTSVNTINRAGKRRRTRYGWGSRPDPRRREGERQVSTLHKDHRDVLIAPVVSEKSYGLLDANKYTFIVHPDANKTEIKIAVEKVFDVKVTSVNTINRQGKTRRTRYGMGKRPNTKRAIVSLAEGHRIDIFGGPVS
jgi:large subunit ribosomal protein L23